MQAVAFGALGDNRSGEPLFHYETKQVRCCFEVWLLAILAIRKDCTTALVAEQKKFRFWITWTSGGVPMDCAVSIR